MSFLLRFAAWATVAFVPAWYVHPWYERILGAIAGRLASPPGMEIEVTDLELFFPFDLGVFVALVLASTWVSWPKRGRALGVGLAGLIALELVILTVGLAVMLRAADPAPAERLVTGAVRIGGLVAAAAAWLLLLGRERLSLAAKTWLGG